MGLQNQIYRKGKIDRFKEWLVAKGFTQVPGIDFDEIFNPIIKPTTTRMVTTLAMSSN